VTAGDLTVHVDTDAGNGITASGNVLLDTKAADLVLNADVTSSAGHISLNAAQDVLLNATLSTTGTAKTVDVLATNNVTMSNGASITTNNSDARLEAKSGNITTEIVNVGTGSLNLIAGTDILDIDNSSLMTADGLMMTAGSGIGISTNVFNTAVGTLAASAAADGIFVTETNGLIIGDVTTTVSRVASDATDSNTATSDTQEDLVTTDNGGLVITVTAGNLKVNAGTDVGNGITASGNVLLDTKAADLVLNADVTSSAGHISLNAAQNVLLNATLSTTGTAKTVDVLATNNVTMSNGASITTNNSDARLEAKSGNITTKIVNVGTGSLNLIAGTDILDIVNSGVITANTLTMTAAGAIGSTTNTLNTAVGMLTASATNGSVYVTDTDDLVVGDVTSTKDVVLTASNGLTMADNAMIKADNLSLSARAAIGTEAKAINTTVETLTANANAGSVFVTETNGLTLGKVSGTNGNIIVTTRAGNLVLDQAVTANAVNLVSGASIVDAGTNGLITADTLTMTAAGAIGSATNTLNTTVGMLTASANVGSVYVTDTDDLVVGDVTSKKDVVLTASNALTMADNAMIKADNLNLSAGTAIGTESKAINTTVETLTASVGAGSVFVTETNGLTLGKVSGTNNITVTTTAGNLVLDQAVTANAVSLVSGASILDAGTNGSITANTLTMTAQEAIGSATKAINTTVGTLTASATNGSVYVTDTDDLIVGNVTSSNDDVVLAASGALTMADNAMITADNLTMTAGTAIGSVTKAMNTTVETLTASAGAGSVFVTETDSIRLASITATDNAVNVTAASDITIDRVNAKSVSLVTSAGSITGNSSTVPNVTATDLSLQSGANIGTATANLTTDVDVIELLSGGGVFITETDNIRIDRVADNNGVTGNNGDFALTTSAGDIAFNDGVVINGSGDIRLQAGKGELLAKDLSINTSGDVEMSADSLTLGRVEATNVSLTAKKTDIAFSQVKADEAVSLFAAGKLLSVSDDSVETNVIASTFNVSSKGHALDLANNGFTSAVAKVADDLIAVKADVLINKGTFGEAQRITSGQDSYIVTNNDAEKAIYAQFISQNPSAQYDSLVEDTLSEAQLEQSLIGFESLNNEQQTDVESSLLSRLQDENRAALADQQNGVDDFVYLSRSEANTGTRSGSNGASEGKTQIEQQLEASILRGSSQTAGANNGLTFGGDMDQGRPSMSPLQTLMSDLVNANGNRQIDILGNTTADYLFFYSTDDNDEESILESIL
ncbi:beta strand repeat-containing protein, partial [Marinomonas algarum]